MNLNSCEDEHAASTFSVHQ